MTEWVSSYVNSYTVTVLEGWVVILFMFHVTLRLLENFRDFL